MDNRASSRFQAPGAAPKKRPGEPLEISPELQDFVGWLFRHHGLDEQAYLVGPLQRRVPACLRTLHVSSLTEARKLLQAHPELTSQALNTLLIGVSSFFRDPGVFEHLRSVVLPRMLARRRGLRIYSAACAAGQEIVSMAWLLEELGVLSHSELLGVDCRPEAIAQATSGVYRGKTLQDLAPAWAHACFQPHGSAFQVLPRVRANIQWRVGNVFSFQAGSGWDVILFRNLAIYLEAQQARPLWEKLVAQLAPGGILLTGKAERPPATLPLSQIFECTYEKRSSAQQTGSSALWPLFS